MYIYIPGRTWLVFQEQASLDFPSCLTLVPSLDHRPCVWKKGISNGF